MIVSKNGFYTPNDSIKRQGKEIMFFKVMTMCVGHYTYITACNPRNNFLRWVWLSSFTDEKSELSSSKMTYTNDQVVEMRMRCRTACLQNPTKDPLENLIVDPCLRAQGGHLEANGSGSLRFNDT